MGDFLANLWESVFTPGATPTLLIATNVTFATLQVLLAGLLIATYSIHFLILSVLCGGLWYSINWFAIELQAAQASQEKEAAAKSSKRESDWKTKGEVDDSADDEGGDTETEGGIRESRESLTSIPVEKPSKAADVMSAGGASAQSSTSGSQPVVGTNTSRQRKPEDVDLSGEVSTDSEWEKVDGAR